MDVIKSSSRLGGAIFIAATLMLTPLAGWAQGSELSTADRIAMLYAPQLNFTRDGDPLIRLGLMEGSDRVEFTPSERIRVMPQGAGGPQIELPANVTYTVEMSNGQAGEYRHWVAVDRLSVEQRSRVSEVVEQWEERGFSPETFEVGGLFAVRGQVFDSRTIIVAVSGTDSMSEANSLRRDLEAQYGIAGSIHSERLSFPSGTLTLRGAGMDLSITHRDVLWVAAISGREDSLAYTIPNIPGSYGGASETRRYTGELIFTPDRNGHIAVINSLGAERVLKGTVPSETFPSAPQDALRAQSIAARNYIFAAIGVRNLADPYMLRTDVYDQVYGGIDREDARTSAAVDATRGEVMLAGNRIISAVYSSNAGGFTENNDNVWDAEAQDHLRGRVDAAAGDVPAQFRNGITEDNLQAFLDHDFAAFSRNAPVSSARRYRWTATVDPSVPREWLRERGEDIGAIRDVEVLSRGISGRVVRMRVTGENGQAIVERELNARRLFGGLYSGLFSMTMTRNRNGTVREFQFHGAGFGHGVGMCQTGAIGMAEQGYGYGDILTHYYQGVDIRQLY